MKTGALGTAGIDLSVLGFGTWQFGSAGADDYWGLEFTDELANALVRQATAAGVTYFDTAEDYAHGGSEEQLGRALKTLSPEVRAKVVIGSKILPNDCGAVREHVEGTCARLGVEAIDLYMVHWPIDKNSMAHFAGGHTSFGESEKDESKIGAVRREKRRGEKRREEKRREVCVHPNTRVAKYRILMYNTLPLSPACLSSGAVDGGRLRKADGAAGGGEDPPHRRQQLWRAAADGGVGDGGDDRGKPGVLQPPLPRRRVRDHSVLPREGHWRDRIQPAAPGALIEWWGGKLSWRLRRREPPTVCVLPPFVTLLPSLLLPLLPILPPPFTRVS